MMTERDLDLLSAYLDGALSSEDRAALEARLETDAALRDELETLRATVGLLRGLPTLQAPRSFTLTREQARRERGARVTGYIVHSAAFRALSAAAVALIVFGAALLTLSSYASPVPAALQSAPASTLAIAAQPTVAAPASPSPAPTLLPPLAASADNLQNGADAAAPPSEPADESAAEAMIALPTGTLTDGALGEADTEAPLMYAVPITATIAADTFAAQPEAAAGSVQRAAEEQESATAAALMMDAIAVTAQAESLPSIAATHVPAQPTMPPAAGLAVPSTPLPTQQPPTATLAPTQTLPPTASPSPTLAPPTATATASPSSTFAPPLAPAPPPAVSTPDIGLLLVIGGVVLFALALGLALLRGRVRG